MFMSSARTKLRVRLHSDDLATLDPRRGAVADALLVELDALSDGRNGCDGRSGVLGGWMPWALGRGLGCMASLVCKSCLTALM